MPALISPRPASRRRFLMGFGVPLGLALAGFGGRAAEAAARERTIELLHLRTGERLRTVYWADGAFRREAFPAIDHLLRDWRCEREIATDPELVDLAWSLGRRLGSGGPVQILCGYRTPETNAMLSRRQRGVAKHSLHLQGMALDLRIPGRRLRDVRRAAMALEGGGVGYYPRSNFVHLDTGDVRTW